MLNLKRSAATLGVVVAGLLAAAGPASAQALPGVVGVKAPASAAGPGSISGEEMTKAIVSVKAPGPSANVPAQISIGTAEVFELNTFGGNDTLVARGTQVGSEGVKGQSPQHTQSLGRENSIECLTLCHEGFEIR